MTDRPGSVRTIVAAMALLFMALAAGSEGATSQVQFGQEQRIELLIRNFEFMLTQPTPFRQGLPSVFILRNQDIVRHGFTSAMLSGLLVHAEGEGVASYGKGVEGFYVDPGKTLVIRFTTERPGSYSFRCDLHPQMKGELFLLEVPAV